MRILIFILLFPIFAEAQKQHNPGPTKIPLADLPVLRCSKDTAAAWLEVYVTDTTRRRLRVGYVVADKCKFVGDVIPPYTWHYYNTTFLNLRKRPFTRLKVYKFQRKK